jgi:L-arabinokinase
MWHVVEPRADLPDDTARCLAAINQSGAFFDPTRVVTLARAPGRLDLMGGIADYSGALVLQWPLANATWVAAQPVDEPVVRIHSRGRRQM